MTSTSKLARRRFDVVIVGAGGSGTSTIAMALAQAWASTGTDTVLVDGCRRADLAVYHDVGDVIPGLPELVELHRGDDAVEEGRLLGHLLSFWVSRWEPTRAAG